MTEEVKTDLLESSELITHHFILCHKFPAIFTEKGNFRIQVNYTHGFSDYAEYKELMKALPPHIKTSIPHLSVFKKLEEFYTAHENNTLWKLLPSLQSLQPTDNLSDLDTQP